MTEVNLTVSARKEIGKKVQQLRAAGKLPAVVYGHGVTPVNVTVDHNQFAKLYSTAGESTLINLNIDNQQPVKVLIQEIQRDPMSHNFLHVDFHQVRMDEKLKTDVKLEFIGEAPAVKELSAILVTTVDSLPIECLPKDLVHEIKVDLSSLKTFSDVIRVADLTIPQGIKVLSPADEMIALVQEPRSEKEFEVTAAPAAEAAPAEATTEAGAVEESKE